MMETVFGLIRFRLDNEASIPTLANGEPFFAKDTARFWIGSEGGNVQIIGALDDKPALLGLAELTPAADRLPYFTSPTSAALTELTPKARELLADVTADDMLATLGGEAAVGSGAIVRKDSPTFSGTIAGTITLAGPIIFTPANLSIGGHTLVMSGDADISGTNTGDQLDIPGNAGTATALQTPRTINGVPFDGTGDIVVPVAASDILGTVATSQGGTGISTYALGDLLYASAANVLGTLSANVTTTAKFLSMVGNGTIPTSLAWATLAAGDIPDLSATYSVKSAGETLTGVKSFSPTSRTSGSSRYFGVIAPADTGLAASTEAVGVLFQGNTRQWATGALATQREILFSAPTLSFVGASTATEAATVAITGAPIAGVNATISDGYALWVQGGAVRLDGSLSIGSGRRDRGPLFILNDPTGASIAAGYNAGAQIWVGNNPTGTPGAGDAIALTLAVINGNSRGQLWGANILVGRSDLGAGWTDANCIGLEINMYNGFALTESNPYGGTQGRKNMLELVAQAGGFPLTSAAMIWATTSTGDDWCTHGIALSRCLTDGIKFYVNPNGGTDTGVAFATAAIYDASNSNMVLKVDGTHGAIIDLSGNPALTGFVLGKSSADTILTFWNNANHANTLAIDSGQSSAQISALQWQDRGGGKFSLYKDAANNLIMFNLVTSGLSWWINGANDQVIFTSDIGVNGTPNLSGVNRAITINGTGTAGLEIATAGAIRGLLSTDGSTYVQLVSVGNIPTWLGTNSVVLLVLQGTVVGFCAGGGINAGGAARAIFIGNATAAPTGSVSAGGVLWVESGTLRYKGSSGTVTVLANA